MNQKEKKVEEIKKVCPLNPGLECSQCKWFQTVDRIGSKEVKQCKVDRIIALLFSLEVSANVPLVEPSYHRG